MQRSIRPIRQATSQPAEPAPTSAVNAVLNKLGLTKETRAEEDAYVQPPEPERAPASAVNAIMGKLGLARMESEPNGNDDELAHDLTDPSWAVRMATVQKLGHIGEYAPLELFLIALHDSHSSVRIAAARALSRNPRPATLSALLAILTDTEWVVRTEAVRALGKLSDPEALPSLLVATRDPDAAVRAATLLALTEISPIEAMAPLHDALQDEDWSVRETATLLLAKYTTPTPLSLRPSAHVEQNSSINPTVETEPQRLSPYLVPMPALLCTPNAAYSENSDAQHKLNTQHPQEDTIPASFQETHVKDKQFLQRTPARQRWSPPLETTVRRVRKLNLMHLAEGLLIVLIALGLLFTWLVLSKLPNVSAVRPSAPVAFTIYRGHTRSVEKLAWSPDGHLMASADNRGTVQIWQVSNGHLIAGGYTQTGQVLALSWSDTKTLLVAYGGPHQSLQIQQLSITSSLALKVQAIFQLLHLPSTPSVAAWSPDGSILAFDAGQGEVQLWMMNAETHQHLLTLSGPPNTVLNQLRWSPLGDQLATVSLSGLLQIWNASTGAIITTLHNEQQITSAAWIQCDQDTYGVIFTQPYYNLLLMWCPTHKEETSPFFLATPSNNLNVGAIAVSPKSLQILLATSDGMVQMYNASNGRFITAYAGHRAQVNAFAWSPNGRAIATASMDTTVQIWPAS